MNKTKDFLEFMKLIEDKGEVFLKPKGGVEWPVSSTETRLWCPKDPNEQYETSDGEVVMFVVYESYKGNPEDDKDKITFEDYQNRKSVTLTGNVVYYSRTLQAVCVYKIDKMYTYIREENGSVTVEEDVYPHYHHKILIFDIRKEIQGEYGEVSEKLWDMNLHWKLEELVSKCTTSMYMSSTYYDPIERSLARSHVISYLNKMWEMLNWINFDNDPKEINLVHKENWRMFRDYMSEKEFVIEDPRENITYTSERIYSRNLIKMRRKNEGEFYSFILDFIAGDPFIKLIRGNIDDDGQSHVIDYCPLDLHNMKYYNYELDFFFSLFGFDDCKSGIIDIIHNRAQEYINKALPFEIFAKDISKFSVESSTFFGRCKIMIGKNRYIDLTTTKGRELISVRMYEDNMEDKVKIYDNAELAVLDLATSYGGRMDAVIAKKYTDKMTEILKEWLVPSERYLEHIRSMDDFVGYEDEEKDYPEFLHLADNIDNWDNPVVAVNVQRTIKECIDDRFNILRKKRNIITDADVNKEIIKIASEIHKPHMENYSRELKDFLDNYSKDPHASGFINIHLVNGHNDGIFKGITDPKFSRFSSMHSIEPLRLNIDIIGSRQIVPRMSYSNIILNIMLIPGTQWDRQLEMDCVMEQGWENVITIKKPYLRDLITKDILGHNLFMYLATLRFYHEVIMGYKYEIRNGKWFLVLDPKHDRKKALKKYMTDLNVVKENGKYRFK
jgi:hypothetical protein|nr:MAG TPA: hypothetical protein [Caudoviricetes sp.]